MQESAHSTYCFSSSKHWSAGLADRIHASDEGLAVASRLSLSGLRGTSVVDSTSAITIDPCGDLYWVRSTFELMRMLDSGPLSVGSLGRVDPSGSWQPVSLVVGFHRIWLLIVDEDKEESQLLRYEASGLQRLSTVSTPRSAIALCGDEGDGVWVVRGGTGDRATVERLDADGELLGSPRELPVPLKRAAIARTADGDMLVLDPAPINDPCEIPLAWRIWRIDPCAATQDKPAEVFRLPVSMHGCYHNFPSFDPDRIAVDRKGRVLLVDRARGDLWILSFNGEVLAQHTNVAPQAWKPLSGIATAQQLFFSGAMGLARLTESDRATGSRPDSMPTYITPVLRSPDGVLQGWARADLDAVLPDGSTFEISVAATSDENVVREVQQVIEHTALTTLHKKISVEELLPWEEASTTFFNGSEWPQSRPIRIPLDHICGTHLWLRIRVHTTEGAPVPKIKRLRVHYPNVGLTSYLPAIYSESKSGRAWLRRFVMLFESIFGDLDTELHNLPRRIDPLTAEDAWLPTLLGWLGFPAPEGLTACEQRVLLRAAPSLRKWRGTSTGLVKLLEVFEGLRFSVNDAGEEHPPWVLPTDDLPVAGPRLGRETLVLCAPQPGFRLGSSGVLGAQALGETTLDSTALFARRSLVVSILVEESGSHRERRERFLRRYIPFFIPAHCRYRLRFVAPSRLNRAMRVGDPIPLEGAGPQRIGDGAQVGRIRLPYSSMERGYLDESALLDDGFWLP